MNFMLVLMVNFLSFLLNMLNMFYSKYKNNKSKLIRHEIIISKKHYNLVKLDWFDLFRANSLLL